mmetsp:Transcript_8346/g.15097  ORF Transcript_8346/g.15097 Transcript_8346/m.15097 type:complete len:438 (-) Transcript_8346:542-1855(-)
MDTNTGIERISSMGSFRGMERVPSMGSFVGLETVPSVGSFSKLLEAHNISEAAAGAAIAPNSSSAFLQGMPTSSSAYFAAHASGAPFPIPSASSPSYSGQLYRIPSLNRVKSLTRDPSYSAFPSRNPLPPAAPTTPSVYAAADYSRIESASNLLALANSSAASNPTTHAAVDTHTDYYPPNNPSAVPSIPTSSTTPDSAFQVHTNSAVKPLSRSRINSLSNFNLINSESFAADSGTADGNGNSATKAIESVAKYAPRPIQVADGLSDSKSGNAYLDGYEVPVQRKTFLGSNVENGSSAFEMIGYLRTQLRNQSTDGFTKRSSECAAGKDSGSGYDRESVGSNGKRLNGIEKKPPSRRHQKVLERLRRQLEYYSTRAMLLQQLAAACYSDRSSLLKEKQRLGNENDIIRAQISILNSTRASSALQFQQQQVQTEAENG